MIRSAHLRLTLAYTIGIALIMAAFSIALYIALQGALAGSIDVGNSQLEQQVLSAELSRARLALVAVNIVGWVVSAIAAYIVAGRTLKPIETSVQRQRQFTAHASHELRTPLTIMKGEIDVTLARERSSEQYRQTLGTVNTEVDRMERMVGDLLTLAQVETNHVVTQREPCKVTELVADVETLFTSQLAGKHIRLVKDIAPDLEANLDLERIRHLLRNLVDNAIRYTTEGGEIRIEAKQRGGELELLVFNSGSHIAPTDLPHLFVPFFRGKGSDRGKGTGLGLALCDWVARAHGGSITAQNVTGGVAFVTRLPRIK